MQSSILFRLAYHDLSASENLAMELVAFHEDLQDLFLVKALLFLHHAGFHLRRIEILAIGRELLKPPVRALDSLQLALHHLNAFLYCLDIL